MLKINRIAKAYLEITLTIEGLDRAGVAGVYALYKKPFLTNIKGALSQKLLVHVEEMQLLHGFDSLENAQEYLLSSFFNRDVLVSLQPYLKGRPDIKIYSVV